MEGDSDAVRTVRWLIGDSHKTLVIQITKGAKARYPAGAEAATSRVLPLIAEAVERFQWRRPHATRKRRRLRNPC